MSDLVILCPSRGRPAAAREAYESFLSTKARDASEIMFVVDDDDPSRVEYEGERFLHLTQSRPGNMVAALNDAALWAIERWSPRYLGFIGDDHRFRTPGWDQFFVDLLEERGGGMVYGNDLNRVDGDIPTQIVMSTEIVSTLGWMGLPTCKHLYIDNAWRVIGDEAGMLFYMPDVVIEHLHPAFGKAEWDEGHQRVNARSMYDHDAEAFAAWVSGSAHDDVERVKKALGK
jgi:glycosyltransferase involved in cell wall biosynthesis